MGNTQKTKVPPLKEFLKNVRCNQLNYGGAIFTTSTNGDSYKVATINGIENNITNFVGDDEFDSNEVLDHQLELTNFITDAIKEKFDRDFK